MVVKTIVDQYGPITCLVNNAGGQISALAAQTSTRALDSVFRLNVSGTWNVLSAVFHQSMKKHGGTVVTIAASFENGFPMLMTGAASRAAQINMTKTLAVEWAASGIRLNVVSPGFILSSGLSAYPNTFQSLIVKKHAAMPAARCGTESEVADVVSFLLSDRASYITGQNIVVDGGSSLMQNFNTDMFLRKDKPFPVVKDVFVKPDLSPAIQALYDSYTSSRL